jgi:hypothetical protein
MIGSDMVRRLEMSQEELLNGVRNGYAAVHHMLAARNARQRHAGSGECMHMHIYTHTDIYRYIASEHVVDGCVERT